MQEFDREALEGLTLEEAVQFLTPRQWDVIVHRYEDAEYPIDELSQTYRLKTDGSQLIFERSTISLDIQDGKVYDFTMHIPDDVI